jgi:hypothetical protein
MNPNRLSRAHAPGENSAHPLLKQSAARSLPNQYAELKRLIKQRGLLDQQPAYFAGKSLLTLGLLRHEEIEIRRPDKVRGRRCPVGAPRSDTPGTGGQGRWAAWAT